MTNSTENNEIRVDVIGALGVITLNRPKALNSLTHNMIKTIHACLDEWESNDAVKAVFFRGEGERAFCAGGDIKYIYHAKKEYESGASDDFDPADYFYDEYNMNRRLFHYPKPLIAFMDGITMGGGYGVAGPCDFRIATKSTVFAMPEVGIGFFPDIGGIYHLLQCRKNIAEYLCLTGESINYADTIWSGVATHYMAAKNEERLLAQLALNGGDSGEIDMTLQAFQSSDIADPQLAQYEAILDQCFACYNVQDALNCLEKQDNSWAQERARIMKSRSPLSLAVTMRHLNESRLAGFDTVIRKDYEICQHFMNGHDFFEGVRAAVIDKDKAPQWQNQTIRDVRDSEIDAYFAPAKRELY